MKYFKVKPDITKHTLNKLNFIQAGKFKSKMVYEKRVELPFNINPFENLINCDTNDCIVLTAHASKPLKKHYKTSHNLYFVSAHSDYPGITDIILTNTKSLKKVISAVKTARENHDEFGKFIMDNQKKKPELQIIKNVKNIFKL